MSCHVSCVYGHEIRRKSYVYKFNYVFNYDNDFDFNGRLNEHYQPMRDAMQHDLFSCCVSA